MSYDGRCSLSEVGLANGKVGLCVLAEEESYLRSGLGENLNAFTFATPTHSGKDGHLQVGHIALIGFSDACAWVDDGVIVWSQDAFFPSYLGKVHLGHNGTNAFEVFLRGIAQGQSTRQTGMHVLRHLRHESHITHYIAAIEANGQLVTMLADLGHRCVEYAEDK